MSRTPFYFSATTAIALAATGLFASGCSSTQGKKDGNGTKVAGDKERVEINKLKGEDVYANIPEDKLTFRDDKGSAHTADEDVSFDPADKDHYDPVMVAQWVKSRRAIMEWCREQRRSVLQDVNEKGGYETPPYKLVFADDPKRTETRLDQAISVAFKIIEKVPDTPEVRLRLAQMCFVMGANEFWNIDTGSREILSIWKARDEEKRLTADEAELQQKRIEALVEPHRKLMIGYHITALQQFQAYEAAMPMQHPCDYYFKIHFQLGNFDKALQYLTETLDNPDLKPEVRQHYEVIEKEIREYFVEVKMNDLAPKPGSPERMRRPGAQGDSGRDASNR